MTSLNLGILAHVDAGKTSLTERLLYTAGVIDEIGSVDSGSTRTDSLELERRRGITIKSAVVSFDVAGTTVNLIDTPGHPDFIAEVERVLSVLDGAVLVISAVEGVQAQTLLLWRALHRLGIPTVFFVNKVDRGGARDAGVLAEIAGRLTPDIVAMSRVDGLGTRGARVTPVVPSLETLADKDEAALRAYVDGGPAPALADVLRRVHPVFFGSAITGAGIGDLIAGITSCLPAAPAGDGVMSGTVFKVDRGPAGERIAYVRMFSGALGVRDRVGDDKVTAIHVFDRGDTTPRPQVVAGDIALLRGLGAIRIGDPIGTPPDSGREHFAPPSLETVVVADDLSQKGVLHAALAQLAEQDPLINLRQDDTVSLYGEVQKEVIEATLRDSYGLAVTFRETTTICIERPVHPGAAYELLKVGPNPFLATVGLRIDPAPPGSGISFALEVELGSMPYAFFRAVEETVPKALAEGLGRRIARLAGDRLRGDHDAFRVRGAAESRARHVRQVDVQHGR